MALLNPQMALVAAQAVLAVHLLIAAFIAAGLVVIPLGARLGWGFVRIPWLRGAHAAAMGVVALQKVAGRACFLTVWEERLAAAAAAVPHSTPAFLTFGERILYWNLPLTFFTWLYGLLFAWVVALWFLVPVWRSVRRRGPPAGV
jgi:hypothetical protein